MDQVYTHTHTLISFTALDVLITTLNEQLIKVEFLRSLPALPFLLSSLLRKGKLAFNAGIPESIAKGKQAKPGDTERVRTEGDVFPVNV